MHFKYQQPTKISLQFGKSEKSGIKEKDKYGNVALDIQQVVIFADQEDKDKIIILGKDKALIVKLDNVTEIDNIINAVNVK